MIAGTLEIQLMAQMSRLAQDMKQAQTTVSSAMGGIEKVVGQAKVALGALGVTFGAAMAIQNIKRTIDAADEISKMSKKVGISTEELSKFKYAADLAGVEVMAVQTGVKKLSQNMVEASDATSKSGRLMTLMGVDLNKGTLPAIEKIADTFRNLPDGPTKAALAVELFGKTGLDIIPLLNEGAAGIKKLTDEATVLGLVLDKETAAAAETFNDNLKGVAARLEGAKIAIMNHMAPAMIRITEAMKQAAIESGVLKAVWIALGGIAAEFLGLNDSDAEKMAKHLRKLKDEVSDLGKHIDPERQKQLLAGMVQPLNMIEGQWVKINQQMRITQGTLDAMAGKIDDQASRAARQGEVLNPYARARGASEKDIRDALGGKGVGDVDAAYRNLLKTLKEKLAVDQKLTESEKLKLQFEAMSAKQLEQFTPAQREELERLAKRVDQLNANKQAREAQMKAEEMFAEVMQEIAELERNRGDARTKAVLDTERMIEDLQLETKMMSMTNLERKKEVALRDLARQGITAESQGYVGLVSRLMEAIDAEEAQYQKMEQIRKQAEIWDELGDAAGRFFSDVLTVGGKAAVDNLRRWMKQLLADMIGIFAKKWILSLGASMSGSASLTQAAANAGGNSLLGNAMSWAGNAGASALGFSGLGTFAEFFGAASGSIPTAAIGAEAVAAGVGTNTLAANAGAWMSGLGATGWGLIIVAAVAVLAKFLDKHGGPKMEGQFTGRFDASGNLIGEGGRSFNIIGTEADAAAKKFVEQFGKGINSAITSLGGKGGAFDFGVGIVKDPRGDAPTFIDTILKDAAGNILFQQHNANVGRSDEELQAELNLQSQRALLAAVQASELPKRIAGIFDGLDPNTATLEEIAAAFQRANESQAAFAQAWARFNDQFMTDAEKLQVAQEAVNKTFTSLGLAVPKTNSEFRALVLALDEAGEDDKVDALLGIADAFKFVADTAQAAADAMMERWEQVQSEIDRITGRDRTASQLDSLVQQFIAANPWASGHTTQQLIAALTTITQQDFMNYSEEQQKLILAILSLATGVDQLSGAVDNVAQAQWTAYQQQVDAAQDFARSFYTNLQNTFGQQPFDERSASIIGALTTQVANTSAQLDAAIYNWFAQQGTSAAQVNSLLAQYRVWQPNFSLTDLYNASYGTRSSTIDGMINQITMYKTYLAEQTADLQKYHELEAQYAGHGEALLELQKWYDEQKALFAGNSSALEDLAQEFADRWDAIINGAAENTGDLEDLTRALADVRASIKEWRDSLLLSDLSPLTATERYAAALSQYNRTFELAALGDLSSLQDYQGVASALLQETISYYGRASTQYRELFNQILGQSGSLAAAEDPVVAGLGEITFTIREENRMLREEVRFLSQQVANLTTAVTTSGDNTVNAIESTSSTATPAPALT